MSRKEADIEIEHTQKSVTKFQNIYFLFLGLRGRSQTTFRRQSWWVVQKCPLFVNVHTIANVNAGGRWSKKPKSCQLGL